MYGHKCLVGISDRYLHYLPKSKMLMKNALCFIMGYFVAMETYAMLLLSMHFLQGT